MTKGIKTSEFWTTIAMFLGTGATVAGTVFDKSFLANHPVFSAVVAGVALVIAGASQIAYTIGRSLVKSAQPTVLGDGSQPTA